MRTPLASGPMGAQNSAMRWQPLVTRISGSHALVAIPSTPLGQNAPEVASIATSAPLAAMVVTSLDTPSAPGSCLTSSTISIPNSEAHSTKATRQASPASLSSDKMATVAPEPNSSATCWHQIRDSVS